MRLKGGAKLSVALQPRMYAVYYEVVKPLWISRGLDFTLTEAVGGVHMRGSKHFKGLAIDMRTWRPGTHKQMPAADKELLADELRALLPGGYQVVVHATHIHIEYDPS